MSFAQSQSLCSSEVSYPSNVSHKLKDDSLGDTQCTQDISPLSLFFVATQKFDIVKKNFSSDENLIQELEEGISSMSQPLCSTDTCSLNPQSQATFGVESVKKPAPQAISRTTKSDIDYRNTQCTQDMTNVSQAFVPTDKFRSDIDEANSNLKENIASIRCASKNLLDYNEGIVNTSRKRSSVEIGSESPLTCCTQEDSFLGATQCTQEILPLSLAFVATQEFEGPTSINLNEVNISCMPQSQDATEIRSPNTHESVPVEAVGSFRKNSPNITNEDINTYRKLPCSSSEEDSLIKAPSTSSSLENSFVGATQCTQEMPPLSLAFVPTQVFQEIIQERTENNLNDDKASCLSQSLCSTASVPIEAVGSVRENLAHEDMNALIKPSTNPREIDLFTSTSPSGSLENSFVGATQCTQEMPPLSLAFVPTQEFDEIIQKHTENNLNEDKASCLSQSLCSTASVPIEAVGSARENLARNSHEHINALIKSSSNSLEVDLFMSTSSSGSLENSFVGATQCTQEMPPLSLAFVPTQEFTNEIQEHTTNAIDDDIFSMSQSLCSSEIRSLNPQCNAAFQSPEVFESNRKIIPPVNCQSSTSDKEIIGETQCTQDMAPLSLAFVATEEFETIHKTDNQESTSTNLYNDISSMSQSLCSIEIHSFNPLSKSAFVATQVEKTVQRGSQEFLGETQCTQEMPPLSLAFEATQEFERTKINISKTKDQKAETTENDINVNKTRNGENNNDSSTDVGDSAQKLTGTGTVTKTQFLHPENVKKMVNQSLSMRKSSTVSGINGAMPFVKKSHGQSTVSSHQQDSFSRKVDPIFFNATQIPFSPDLYPSKCANSSFLEAKHIPVECRKSLDPIFLQATQVPSPIPSDSLFLQTTQLPTTTKSDNKICLIKENNATTIRRNMPNGYSILHRASQQLGSLLRPKVPVPKKLDSIFLDATQLPMSLNSNVEDSFMQSKANDLTDAAIRPPQNALLPDSSKYVAEGNSTPNTLEASNRNNDSIFLNATQLPMSLNSNVKDSYMQSKANDRTDAAITPPQNALLPDSSKYVAPKTPEAHKNIDSIFFEATQLQPSFSGVEEYDCTRLNTKDPPKATNVFLSKKTDPAFIQTTQTPLILNSDNNNSLKNLKLPTSEMGNEECVLPIRQDSIFLQATQLPTTPLRRESMRKTCNTKLVESIFLQETQNIPLKYTCTKEDASLPPQQKHSDVCSNIPPLHVCNANLCKNIDAGFFQATQLVRPKRNDPSGLLNKEQTASSLFLQDTQLTLPFNCHAENVRTRPNPDRSTKKQEDNLDSEFLAETQPYAYDDVDSTFRANQNDSYKSTTKEGHLDPIFLEATQCYTCDNVDSYPSPNQKGIIMSTKNRSDHLDSIYLESTQLPITFKCDNTSYLRLKPNNPSTAKSKNRHDTRTLQIEDDIFLQETQFPQAVCANENLLGAQNIPDLSLTRDKETFLIASDAIFNKATQPAASKNDCGFVTALCTSNQKELTTKTIADPIEYEDLSVYFEKSYEECDAPAQTISSRIIYADDDDNKSEDGLNSSLIESDDDVDKFILSSDVVDDNEETQLYGYDMFESQSKKFLFIENSTHGALIPEPPVIEYNDANSPDLLHLEIPDDEINPTGIDSRPLNTNSLLAIDPVQFIEGNSSAEQPNTEQISEVDNKSLSIIQAPGSLTGPHNNVIDLAVSTSNRNSPTDHQLVRPSKRTSQSTEISGEPSRPKRIRTLTWKLRENESQRRK